MQRTLSPLIAARRMSPHRIRWHPPLSCVCNCAQPQTYIDNTGFASGSPFNFAQMQQSATDADAIIAASSGLTAATFGISSGHAQHDPINVDLAAMTANLTATSAAITGSSDYLCAKHTEDLTIQILNLTDRVLELTSEAKLNETFACGFYRTAVDGIITPSLRGPVRDATGAIAFCLLLAGAFALLLVWALIALQIELGDVGIEPGCPSCCRCCCCYKPGINVQAGRLIDFDKVKASDAAVSL